jgi:hypothetical protein
VTRPARRCEVAGYAQARQSACPATGLRRSRVARAREREPGIRRPNRP